MTVAMDGAEHPTVDDDGFVHAEPGRRIGGATLLGMVAVVIAVVPIWVAAIRDGMAGVYPVSDAASTVMRARDVFSGPFPLVGMPAAGATGRDFVTYFPGAWQLYVISVPTELFGSVWGPVLAMAALNTLWTALAGWLLLRRLRLHEAMIGIAFFTVLLWALGSGFVVTPVPMDMVMIPMALFLIAVWAVADGDLVAVPVLALVANFLWLDHLVLVVTVPIVGLCAPIGFWLWVRRTRRREPDAYPALRRRVWRSMIWAAAITVIMWLPTVIQQLTASPGNLRLLVESAGVDRPTVGSWPYAFHTMLSVVARPPMWFRGTLGNPSFLRPNVGGTVVDGLATFDVVFGVLLVAGLVILAGLAHRRDDRAGVWLVIVAGVAMVMAVISAQSAPSYFGPPTGYLRSLWPTAMFVWFAVTINVLRIVAPRLEWSAIVPSLAVIVGFSVLNIPASGSGYGSGDRLDEVVRAMNAAVVPRISVTEPVLVSMGIGFNSQRLGAPLALALSDAGVPVCRVRSERAGIGAGMSVCPPDVSKSVFVLVTSEPAKSLVGKELFRKSLLDATDRRDLDRMKSTIDGWLEGRTRLVLSSAAERKLTSTLPTDMREQIREMLEPANGDVSDLRTTPLFGSLIKYWYATHQGESADLFVDSPLTADEWRRWLDLGEEDLTVVVAERDLD